MINRTNLFEINNIAEVFQTYTPWKEIQKYFEVNEYTNSLFDESIRETKISDRYTPKVAKRIKKTDYLVNQLREMETRLEYEMLGSMRYREFFIDEVLIKGLIDERSFLKMRESDLLEQEFKEYCYNKEVLNEINIYTTNLLRSLRNIYGPFQEYIISDLDVEGSFDVWNDTFKVYPSVKFEILIYLQKVPKEEFSLKQQDIFIEEICANSHMKNEFIFWNDKFKIRNPTLSESKFIALFNLFIKFEKWFKNIDNPLATEDQFLVQEIKLVDNRLMQLNEFQNTIRDEKLAKMESEYATDIMLKEIVQTRLNQVLKKNEPKLDQSVEVVKELSIEESRTKSVIEEEFEGLDKVKGWQYAFTTEEGYSTFSNLLISYFTFKPFSQPQEEIRLNKDCTTRFAKVLRPIYKALGNENKKLKSDDEFFEIIKTLNHFKDLSNSRIYDMIMK